MKTKNSKLKEIIHEWGHLIGTGGLHLPEEEAAQIQDDFQEWIISKLKKI